jgi:hypothetical protein
MAASFLPIVVSLPMGLRAHHAPHPRSTMSGLPARLSIAVHRTLRKPHLHGGGVRIVAL